MEPEFVVAYDITAEGVGATPLGLLAGWLVGVVLGYLLLRRERRKPDGRKEFVTVWLILWVSIGGVGLGNVSCQRLRCLMWARNNNFEVVEGIVQEFKPMPPGGHTDESFWVGKRRFHYSDYDLSTGAFNNCASQGGPIREGRYVRITHHTGRILRVEVRK